MLFDVLIGLKMRQRVLSKGEAHRFLLGELEMITSLDTIF